MPSGRHHAECSEKEHDTHDRRDADRECGGPRHVTDPFSAHDTGVDETMSARERDVSADGAAHDGDDGEHIDSGRNHSRTQRLQIGRTRRDGHVHREADHEHTKDLSEAIHGAAGLRNDEQTHADAGAHYRASARVQPRERLQSQGTAADVADVEGEPANADEEREQPAEPGQQLIREILGASSADGEHTPDVELGNEVDNDRRQNGEREARTQLIGENGGLGEKTGPDRGRGHEERGAEKRGAQRFTIHGPQ